MSPGPTRRRRRRGRDAAAVLAALAVASACTGDDGGQATATTAPGTTTTTAVEREHDGRLLIGVLVPITGGGSELGQPMLTAIENARQQINLAGGVLGDDVLTIERDEASGTALAELIELGVDAVIGPVSSLTALTQLSQAVEGPNGVVVCSPSATALALDDYPDSGLFFRTAPSDSLQMAAVAAQVARTGARSVAVGYLDDPYGRALHEAFLAEIAARRLPVDASVGFSGDESDLSGSAQELLDTDAGAIVVLADADDGGRLLTALDEAPGRAPQVIVNDSIRAARTTIQTLTGGFRNRLTGVAPNADGVRDTAPGGSFAAHAVDCLNLIALAVTVASTDAPRSFRNSMARVSVDGSPCQTFATCVELLDDRNIDYSGLSGPVDLANSTGDPVRARFESFTFDEEGNENPPFEFSVP